MKYTYVTCCVDCPDVPALSNMIDIAMGITYATAAKYIDMQKTNRMLGYTGCGKLTLKTDYHVSFYRSKYQGKRCYFIKHSCIEYIYTKRRI
jgi:hypothetical protein